MENLYIKEKKLQSVLDKLSNLSKGPKVYKDSVEDLYVEKNQLQSEKNEIENNASSEFLIRLIKTLFSWSSSP